jgi:uncharacterized protein YjbI with pentapeptide repeats
MLQTICIILMSLLTNYAQAQFSPSPEGQNSGLLTGPQTTSVAQPIKIARLVKGVCLDEDGNQSLNSRHGYECVDLSRSMFAGNHLVDRTMRGFSFTNSMIKRVDFTRADLSYSNFRNTRVANSTFESAILEMADFRGSDVSGSDFINAKAKRAQFSGIHSRQIQFKNADLSSAKLISMFCEKCNFEGADLSAADLSDSIFVDCSFKGALINSTTKLPFTKDVQKKLGFIYEFRK